MGTEELLGFVMVIAICIGLFLALRNVTLWYFKINEMIELLTQIRNNLRKLNSSDKDSGEKNN